MQKLRRISILGLLLILILLIGIPQISAAGRPAINLLTTWTPNDQLSSTISEDNFVDMQFLAQGNLQFWAIEMECTIINGGVFTTSPAPIMTWGPAWKVGNGAKTYFDPEEGAGENYFDPATNVFKVSATRVGASNSSLGIAGIDYSLLLFNFRLYLSQTVVGTQTVSLRCTKVVFYDRNGVVLGRSRQAVASNLTVRDGYVIDGQASRQGYRYPTEIQIDCEHMASGHTYMRKTDAKGNFLFNTDLLGTSPLRDYGLYQCTYSSQLGGSEQTVYVRGMTTLNLQTPRYHLLPVNIRSGDTNNDDAINVTNDFAAITLNWLQNATPFTSGDVNGDGTVNQTDLVITAGNVDLSEAVPMDHVLYSVALDYAAPYPNNQIWLGDPYSGSVSGFMIGRGQRLFWPQVSPDGFNVAYVAATVDRRQNKAHTIFISDTSRFRPIGIFPRGYAGQDFAPSWSPDGRTLAYICSWSSKSDGYETSNGNLCTVGSNGNPAPSTIIPGGQSQSYARIFPPAWYDNNVIVYAGNKDINDDNQLCPNQLCYYDSASGVHGKITIAGVDGTTTKADMPTIIPYYNGTTFLVYRYRNDSISELRMATIDYSGGSWTGGIQSANGTNTVHETVENSTGVAYYDVSPMLNIMFYKFGDAAFSNLIFSETTEFVWTQDVIHMIDGFAGYPTGSLNYPVTWTQSDDDSTEFNVYKPTFDWIP